MGERDREKKREREKRTEKKRVCCVSCCCGGEEAESDKYRDYSGGKIQARQKLECCFESVSIL